ncbi:hypothetical protein [Deinococcus sp. UYEF24]
MLSHLLFKNGTLNLQPFDDLTLQVKCVKHRSCLLALLRHRTQGLSSELLPCLCLTLKLGSEAGPPGQLRWREDGGQRLFSLDAGLVTTAWLSLLLLEHPASVPDSLKPLK